MEPKPDPKLNIWHNQQAKLLQNWAEVASSYRWMHNQAYMIYKRKNMWFMLPLIIMSTVAGTANFAQSTFPEGIRPYVPQIIGAINLISAIMTTIYQFLKISEFMESHRISSINYGKLARTITIELNLPIKDRSSGGAECVKITRTDIDRLIEQSPAIPKYVLGIYEAKFSGKGLAEPEIVVINKVDIYEDKDNQTTNMIAEAGLKLKSLIKKPQTNLQQELNALPKLNLKRPFLPIFKNKDVVINIPEIETLFEPAREVAPKQVREFVREVVPEQVREVVREIAPEQAREVVREVVPEPTHEPAREVVCGVVPEVVHETLFEPAREVAPEIAPEFIHETLFEPAREVVPERTPEQAPGPEPEIVPEPESEIETVVETVISNLVNDTVSAHQTISDDLELLRNSKLVSTKK